MLLSTIHYCSILVGYGNEKLQFKAHPCCSFRADIETGAVPDNCSRVLDIYKYHWLLLLLLMPIDIKSSNIHLVKPKEC